MLNVEKRAKANRDCDLFFVWFLELTDSFGLPTSMLTIVGDRGKEGWEGRDVP